MLQLATMINVNGVLDGGFMQKDISLSVLPVAQRAEQVGVDVAEVLKQIDTHLEAARPIAERYRRDHRMRGLLNKLDIELKAAEELGRLLGGDINPVIAEIERKAGIR
jgi:hypothetical protein